MKYCGAAVSRSWIQVEVKSWSPQGRLTARETPGESSLSPAYPCNSSSSQGFKLHSKAKYWKDELCWSSPPYRARQEVSEQRPALYCSYKAGTVRQMQPSIRSYHIHWLLEAKLTALYV